MADFTTGLVTTWRGGLGLGCDPFASLTISHAILCALSACDAVTFAEVDVIVNDDAITLSGTVRNSGDDERAMIIAEAVAGTGKVLNRLIVVTVGSCGGGGHAHFDR